MVGAHCLPSTPRNLVLARGGVVVSVCLVALCSSVPHGSAQPTPSNPGAWTPPEITEAPDGPDIAIHMALLPGDGAQYHSKVLWWTGETPIVMRGGLWGWNPFTGDCAAWPTASFQELSLPRSGAVSVFCAGLTHAVVADSSRLLVTGGTEPGSEK